MLESIISQIDKIKIIKIRGVVTTVKGLVIECKGITNFVNIGTTCKVLCSEDKFVLCQVIGFSHEIVLLMALDNITGIHPGALVEVVENYNDIFPDESWLGRVIDACAEPLDNKGPLHHGTESYFLYNTPLSVEKRNKLGGKIDLGVKAIDSFVTCCYGQRMGIFSGSGVGKSILISMLTKYANVDVKVIGLIGERSREVKEFIDEYLGEDGLKQSVIIVATGDQPALTRTRAAYLTMTVAEYFRDQGKEVLCILDSVTRFAMAQREIGLASGEPPTSKGYTPSVFSSLPQLLERAGPGSANNSITGLFSVLVDGDDHNEPISDAVRGILDGHIVLDRKISERNRFPAVDILKSISRTMPGCNSKEENDIIDKIKKMISTYSDMEDLIRIGAYKKGTNPEIDQSIIYYNKIEKFLQQAPKEKVSMVDSYKMLADIVKNTK